MSILTTAPQRFGQFTAAVANAATLFATSAPGAGLRYRVRLIVISASVAGHYQIWDNSGGNVLMYDGGLAAQAPLVIPYPGDGYTQKGANGSITAINQSGAASDMGMTVLADIIPLA